MKEAIERRPTQHSQDLAPGRLGSARGYNESGERV